MEKTIFDTINKYGMIPAGSHILAGFSGGADSCCLLRFLWANMDTLGITLEAAHVNHGLRGEEADRDEAFCVDFCALLGVKLYVFKEDAAAEAKKHGITVEEAGRKIRYERFRSVSRNGLIAVGHNKNDDAETIIMRFFRGTGIKGLCGIPAVSGDVIRPILGVTRSEIERYCREYRIDYCIDSTNASDHYARNKVRNSFITMVERDFNEGITDTLMGMKRVLTDEEDFLRLETENAYTAVAKETEGYVVLSGGFRGLHMALKRRVLRKAVERYGEMSGESAGGLKDITQGHIDDGCGLLDKHTGKRIDLPNGVVIERTYEGLRILRNDAKLPERWEKELFFGQTVYKDGFCVRISDIGEGVSGKNARAFDINMDKTGGNALVFRNRRDGDVVYLEKVGTKKLKDYFIDKKIDRKYRDAMPLVCDGKNVVMMGDGVVNKRYAAAPGDTRVIRVTIWEEQS